MRTNDFYIRKAMIRRIAEKKKTFEEYIKGKKFTHPDTKNKVNFSSLPETAQKKERAKFDKSQKPEQSAGQKIVSDLDEGVKDALMQSALKDFKDFDDFADKSADELSEMSSKDLESILNFIQGDEVKEFSDKAQLYEGEGDFTNNIGSQVAGYDVSTLEEAISKAKDREGTGSPKKKLDKSLSKSQKTFETGSLDEVGETTNKIIDDVMASIGSKDLKDLSDDQLDELASSLETLDVNIYDKLQARKEKKRDTKALSKKIDSSKKKIIQTRKQIIKLREEFKEADPKEKRELKKKITSLLKAQDKNFREISDLEMEKNLEVDYAIEPGISSFASDENLEKIKQVYKLKGDRDKVKKIENEAQKKEDEEKERSKNTRKRFLT